MAARGLVVAVALAVAASGCGDPLGDTLEADRPDDDAPPLVVDEDGDLVEAEPPTTTTVPISGSTGEVVPTTAPAPTESIPPSTTADPGAAAKAVWVESVMAICAEEYAGLATTEPPDDPDGFVTHMRTVAAAYTAWALRVERLPIPDRQTEANLVEGLRRLRRSVDLLGPAVQQAVEGDVDGARQAWWSWGHAISGASTALYAAGVPVDCWT